MIKRLMIFLCALGSFSGLAQFAAGPGFWQVPAQPTIVQVKSAGIATGVATGSVTLTTPATAGDLLIACVLLAGNNTYTISDNKNNNWQDDIDVLNTTDSAWATCWHAQSAIAGTQTITITITGGPQSGGPLEVLEVRGYNYIDQIAGGFASGGTATMTTTAALSSSDELVFAFGSDWDNGAIWTAGSGYALRDQIQDAAGDSSAMETSIVSTGLSGPQTVTFTKNHPADTYEMIVLTFMKSPMESNISYRSSAVTTPMANPVVLNVPAGVQNGDLMIASVEMMAAAVASPKGFTAPGGWTLLQANAHNDGFEENEQDFYYKFAGSSEPATYSWTYNSGALVNASGGVITAYSGVSPIYPIDTFGCLYGNSSFGYVTPSITPVSSYDTLLYTMWEGPSHGVVPALPANMTNRWSDNISGGMTSFGADEALGTAEPTPDIPAVMANGDDFFGCQFALRSAVTPYIFSISPASGPLGGGGTLTLTGQGFASNTTVTIGGQTCTSPLVISSTQMTCTIPSAAATGNAAVALNVNGVSYGGATYSYIPYLVQHTSGRNTSSSAAVAYPSNVTAGNLLIACGFTSTGLSGNVTISDTQSNTWVNDVAGPNDHNTINEGICWHAANATGGATTVTITAPGASFVDMSILEVSGVAASPLDSKNINAQSGSPYSGYLSSTVSNAYAFLYAFASVAATWTPDSNSTVEELNDVSGGQYLTVLQDNTVRIGTGGTIYLSGTKTGAGFSAIIVDFKGK